MALHALEEVVESAEAKTVIRVLGVGGAGCNAVDHMIREGVAGVEFVAINTDAQALSRALAPTKVQLGRSGLGAGSKPEAGREAAFESRDQ
ncbi:MAG TPA: cell division protein FtsZ, partial [Hydrogenophilus thermoluteolus]|nr:cell division protein FtsZ [Hydrogenophilus thermoluteolus]